MEHSDAEPRTAADGTDPECERISAHRSAPDRVVFTEADNSDGWIALDADLPVAVER